MSNENKIVTEFSTQPFDVLYASVVIDGFFTKYWTYKMFLKLALVYGFQRNFTLLKKL